jgi:hypothetical protein
MTMIIVQIPHQRPAIAFSTESFAEIADRAGQKSVAPDVVIWTAAQLTESFDDDVEGIIGAAGIELLARDGCIAEVSLSEVKSDWVAVADAPSKDDIVKEWLGADMSSLHILETADEAKNFVTTWVGHGWTSARAAVRREAERLGWLMEDE